MNTKMLIYCAIMLFGVFISSIAQVLLKKASGIKYNSVLREYLNPLVIIAYSIFFTATFMCILSYRVVPLSMGPILEATGYIYVTIFGVLFFKENINKMKIIGLTLILAGIAVYSLLG